MHEIIIYGAGNMGKAVCKLLEEKCRIICFLDRSTNLKKTYIDGRYPVINPKNCTVNRKYKIVVAIAADTFENIKTDLVKFGWEDQLIVTAGDFIEEMYAEENVCFTNLWRLKSEISPEIYTELFQDEDSRVNWMMAYDWFAYRKETAYQIGDRKKYFPDFLETELKDCKVMLDTAALNGEYIDNFLKENKKRFVYAMILNPPSSDYNTLMNKYDSIKQVNFFMYEAGENNGNCYIKRIGLMEPFTDLNTVECRIKRIDDMEIPYFDYLRCYSMSKAEPILKGAQDSIIKNRPLIAVNIGHYETDFINIPILLAHICKNYKFYFRVHSYQGNDCIMYAVPIKWFL